jgi:hypothetical protein
MFCLYAQAHCPQMIDSTPLLGWSCTSFCHDNKQLRCGMLAMHPMFVL